MLFRSICREAWSVQGERQVGEVSVVRRVVSEETATILTALLKRVVTNGTGHEAAMEGWTVAGKTGTAQKLDPATGTYSRKKYIASFCGFVPANKPRLTLVVILDEPQGVEWGGYNAGPVFRRIAWQAMAQWGVPPDSAIPLAQSSRARNLVKT